MEEKGLIETIKENGVIVGLGVAFLGVGGLGFWAYTKKSNPTQPEKNDSTIDLEKGLTQELYQRQQVIVRIWTSKGNPSKPGENVGHISIETPYQYMSLWPRQETEFVPAAKDVEGLGFYSPISAELVSLETDKKYEGREPEVTYYFYTLDINAIESEFRSVKNRIKGWSLLALCKDGESCASLAYCLLLAGGIGKLTGGIITESTVAATGSTQGFWKASQNSVTSVGYAIVSSPERRNQATGDASAASFYSIEMGIGIKVKSPDFLAELLKKAEQEERKKSPETQNIAKIQNISTKPK